jgi:hypothetical protein
MDLTGVRNESKNNTLLFRTQISADALPPARFVAIVFRVTCYDQAYFSAPKEYLGQIADGFGSSARD